MIKVGDGVRLNPDSNSSMRDFIYGYKLDHRVEYKVVVINRYGHICINLPQYSRTKPCNFDADSLIHYPKED